VRHPGSRSAILGAGTGVEHPYRRGRDGDGEVEAARADQQHQQHDDQVSHGVDIEGYRADERKLVCLAAGFCYTSQSLADVLAPR
jgi:hypothetical protein